MLNFLRPFFARLFSPLIQALARTPVTPNMITVAGTVGVSAAALAMFPIGWLFPGAATATVLHTQVVKEKFATMSPTVEAERLRPSTATPIRNFFLAGDWTRWHDLYRGGR